MLAPLLAPLGLTGLHPVGPNPLFAPPLPRVKGKTQIAVLYPDAMPTDARQLYAEHWETRKTYTFSLAGVPDCGEATACFEAEFSGQKGGTPFGFKRVALARGRHG